MFLFLIALIAFVVIGIMVIKPMAISHYKQFPVWATAYGSIFVITWLSVVVKNEIITNIFAVIFILIGVFLAFKFLVKKNQYRKINNASPTEIDSVMNAFFTKRVILDDVAKLAIQKYENNEGVSLETIYELASNEHTSPQILELLATKPFGYDVMQAVAENPSSSPDALGYLAQGKELPDEVVDAILANPNTRTESIGVLTANIDDLYEILSGTSPHQESVEKGLAVLKERNPELEKVEDRFIIANYSMTLG